MKKNNFKQEIEVSLSSEEIEASMKQKKMEAEKMKEGEYEGKPPAQPSKAKITKKQKEALDKNKDGKLDKEDFDMLKKEKKESGAGYGGKKKSYAEMLNDIASKKLGDKE